MKSDEQDGTRPLQRGSCTLQHTRLCPFDIYLQQVGWRTSPVLDEIVQTQCRHAQDAFSRHQTILALRAVDRKVLQANLLTERRRYNFYVS